jgi:hypothetical protein
MYAKKDVAAVIKSQTTKESPHQLLTTVVCRPAGGLTADVVMFLKFT